MVTEDDRERLKEIINETLDDRDAFSGRTHSDHHRFIEELIEGERRRQERRERIRQQVLGWGVISALSGAGVGAYHLLVDFIRRVSN